MSNLKQTIKAIVDRKDMEGLRDALRDVWRTGKNPISQDNVEFKEFRDAIAIPNALATIPNVITEVAREAAEPLLVLSRFLDTVQHRPGLQIIHGGMGAVTAADVAEGQEYPEVQVQMGGASAVANIGKSGIAFKLTDEMQRYSMFDVINIHVAACGRALARHREEKIANMMTGMGVHVFDNRNPTASLKGVTHGRDELGNPNGAITYDDLFDMFGVVIMNGFMPNLMIVHPLTWIMFMKDPVLRSFALASGGGTFWGSYTGNPAGRAPWATGRLNGPSTGQNITPAGNGQATPLSGMPQIPRLEAGPVAPSYFLPFPFSIAVSYHVYYSPNSRLTDIYICDSAEIGAIVEDEPMTMESWRDPEVEISKIKFRERYGIVIYHQGLAIAVARNVKVDQNHVVLPAKAMIDVSALPAIPSNTPVV